LISVFGSDKVGIKVNPIGRYNDMFDSNPEALYTHLFKQLNNKKIAFIELSKNFDEENYENYGHRASETQF